MSIYNEAVLLYGLPANEVAVDEGQFYEDIEVDGLDRLSTYYDAPNEFCVIGVVIARAEEGSIYLNDAELPNEIQKAKELFEKFTGKEGRLILTTHVY